MLDVTEGRSGVFFHLVVKLESIRGSKDFKRTSLRTRACEPCEGLRHNPTQAVHVIELSSLSLILLRHTRIEWHARRIFRCAFEYSKARGRLTYDGISYSKSATADKI
ncbi:hypothetical protein FRC12_012890 [Ceratobasidium sp. 428]|nr:hypothetical protein FRC12_012890 [Ceratobasidium sp. 428]